MNEIFVQIIIKIFKLFGFSAKTIAFMRPYSLFRLHLQSNMWIWHDLHLFNGQLCVHCTNCNIHSNCFKLQFGCWLGCAILHCGHCATMPNSWSNSETQVFGAVLDNCKHLHCDYICNYAMVHTDWANGNIETAIILNLDSAPIVLQVFIHNF